ncbi:MAG: phosphoadenylyl-sulfate reductase [Pseudomonadota bacterium]
MLKLQTPFLDEVAREHVVSDQPLSTGSVGEGSRSLDDIVEELNADLAQLRPVRTGDDLGHRVAETKAALDYFLHGAFHGKTAIVSSFGAESIVLLHLVAQIDATTPVIFIDTGKHFAQTLAYRRDAAAALGLTNVIDAKGSADRLQAEDPNGDLWRRDPDACCGLRKVEPLGAALDAFDAWITGRKRFQGSLRGSLATFEHANGKIKMNPLAHWSPDHIDQYGALNSLPAHPLVSQGFPSIGCWPCTKAVAQGGDARAGRWQGTNKTECGIHQI